MRLNPKLKEKIMESLSAALSVTGIVLALSVFVVPPGLGMTEVFSGRCGAAWTTAVYSEYPWNRRRVRTSQDVLRDYKTGHFQNGC
ncbi:MAG: hypothetical protein LUI87_01695 [Lachnospiraceae bacterium]|nr:hypothetical protein [Lachnospiraceae bacterium]